MKKVLLAFFMAGVIIFVFAVMILTSLTDTAPLSKGEFLKTFLRLKAYRHTGLVKLDNAEIKTLYRWSCSGRCHGREPIESVRHTAREWQDIIERMRVKNLAKVNKREEKLITAYLQKNFGSNVPTIPSPEAGKFLKQYLWKSDFGESDLYVDIIYAPVEYFEITGEIEEIERFGTREHLVFRVFMNTHQERLDRYPLKDMAILRHASGREEKSIDWTITYESGDMHHFEGILRFKKKKTLDKGKGFMEVVLMDLPGQKERVFRWDLPIPEFTGAKKQ